VKEHCQNTGAPKMLIKLPSGYVVRSINEFNV
jgi:hypothetical protein